MLFRSLCGRTRPQTTLTTEGREEPPRHSRRLPLEGTGRRETGAVGHLGCTLRPMGGQGWRVLPDRDREATIASPPSGPLKNLIVYQRQDSMADNITDRCKGLDQRITKTNLKCGVIGLTFIMSIVQFGCPWLAAAIWGTC